MAQTKLESVLEQVSAFLPDPQADGTLASEKVLSLLYPTPDFEGDHDKFDVVKKNLLSRLDEDSAGPAAMRSKIRGIVESLSRGDLPAGGFAIFTDGEKTEFLELQNSPYPRLALGPAALALPAFADASTSRRFWIAVLDVEQPMLFHVVDGVVKDKTPAEVTTLSETLKQYHPMADVVWHSSSSVRRSGARQQFHALGTATDDLRKDEITRVLNSFGKQVADIVTGNDPLILAGGPSRLGHFRESFSHQNLIDQDIQAAGDALEQDELLDRAFAAISQHHVETDHDTIDRLDTSNALRGADDLVKAAMRGRLDTILLHPDHQGFLSGNDERLRLPEEPDEDFAKRSLAIAYAVKNGADLIVSREHTADGPIATTRYD